MWEVSKLSLLFDVVAMRLCKLHFLTFLLFLSGSFDDDDDDKRALSLTANALLDDPLSLGRVHIACILRPVQLGTRLSSFFFLLSSFAAGFHYPLLYFRTISS